LIQSPSLLALYYQSIHNLDALRPRQSILSLVFFPSFGNPSFGNQGADQRLYKILTYALKRVRPFARLALIIRLPALVAILARNPWVRLRLRLLG